MNSWSTLGWALRRTNPLSRAALLECHTLLFSLIINKQKLLTKLYKLILCTCHTHISIKMYDHIIWLPSLRTNTKSLSITVWILWAIVKMVRSLNSWLIILCNIASVAESTEAVASSRTRMQLFLSKALPRQNNCLCPTLQFSPFSTTANTQDKA